MYEEANVKGGHPCIASAQLLLTVQLQIFYSMRLGGQLLEQTLYNLFG
jgi:hypothetical protein